MSWQDLEPWRYNAYMKRLVGRVEEGGDAMGHVFSTGAFAFRC